jgi:hypothetical protein
MNGIYISKVEFFLTMEIDRAASSSATIRRFELAEDGREPIGSGPVAFTPTPTARDRSRGQETRSRDFSPVDVEGVDGFRRGAVALRATIARLVAWACIAAIAALSLVPGVLRPHTVLPGWDEHFIAYAGTGFFLALGYLGLRQRLFAWIGLAIASGAFEILQDFVPGRSPSPFDALASMSGLTLGLALGAALNRKDRHDE